MRDHLCSPQIEYELFYFKIINFIHGLKIDALHYQSLTDEGIQHAGEILRV